MKDTFRTSRTEIALIVLSMFVLAGCTEPRETARPVQPVLVADEVADSNPEPRMSDDTSQANTLEDRWGIKVERATLSSGGYMVDFRFRVLDKAKAAPVLDRSVAPCLIDQASGARFTVPSPPKVGQLRSGGNIREGAIYYIFFANPARYIQSGNKVTVLVGDFEARDILVQ